MNAGTRPIILVVSNDDLGAALGRHEPIADSVAGEGGSEFGSALVLLCLR
jgi:hypothetical protein